VHICERGVVRAEIVEGFLEEGLVRNAAGKASQVWETVGAAYAVDKLKGLGRPSPRQKTPWNEETVKRPSG